MIKCSLVTLMLFISIKSFQQNVSDSVITYSKVIKVDSTISGEELYSRAKTWFAQTYRSAKDVIQLDDKENSKIIGKGAIKYSSNVFVGSEGTRGWIYYTITVQVKQGRYRYEFTDFNHEGNPFNSGGQFSFGLITNSDECPYKVGTWTSQGWKNKVWKDIKKAIEENTDIIIASLNSSMNKPAQDKDSNW